MEHRSRRATGDSEGDWRTLAAVALACARAAIALGGSAAARPASADKDGRPNILVVMTDDMAATDLALMPNVQQLLAKKGTTFADAIDSFPLCCPARATFITGQYAHNHGVAGNFAPYGWYGMKDRANTLPAWLQDAGYRTALIGKWLNGYGALRRPRRGPGRLRHLARAARRLRLRLLQLRDELRRRAAHLGRRRLRPQAGRVREDRGRRRARHAGVDPGQAAGAVRARAVQLLGQRETRGLLARRHGRDDREAVSRSEEQEEAVLRLVVGRGAAPRGRLDDADGTARAPTRGRRRATPTR